MQNKNLKKYLLRILKMKIYTKNSDKVKKFALSELYI